MSCEESEIAFKIEKLQTAGRGFHRSFYAR